MEKLINILVLYDGWYFRIVDVHYRYKHEMQSHLSLEGFHLFIRSQAKKILSVESIDSCQIVEAHLFAGRYSASKAQEKGTLHGDRVFDDNLIKNNILPHYSLLKEKDGKKHEKGVDVGFALFADDLCKKNKYDLVVLITGDEDFVPLVLRLRSLKTRTMLMGWNIEGEDKESESTFTSKTLSNVVTHYVDMTKTIEEGLEKKDDEVRRLFTDGRATNSSTEDKTLLSSKAEQTSDSPIVEHRLKSTVFSLGDVYGFIRYNKGDNLYFPDHEVEGGINILRADDVVEFTIVNNPKPIEGKKGGEFMAVRVVKIPNKV